MGLSEADIDALAERLVHGAEERYVAELQGAAIDELARGLSYSAEVDLLQLARSYPAKAAAILAKHRDEVGEEVAKAVEEQLVRSAAADMAALAAVHGAEAAKKAQRAFGGATERFKRISKQTAQGVRRMVERDNLALAEGMTRTWRKVAAESVAAVNQGLKPREKVIAEGVQRLMDAGIKEVGYKAGMAVQPDVALRRTVVTEVSQAAGRMSLEAMDAYGHELVITTSHFGARPSHAAWQGLPCGKNGPVTVDGVRYPGLAELTGYGTPGGLKGVNCKHEINAYFPGITRLPDREFKADAKRFGMDSDEYYAAKQRQRELERRVRKTKRDLAGYERANIGLENPAYVQKRLVLGRQQKDLQKWCKQKGLRRHYEREKAYGVDKQPRALRSEAWRKASLDKSVKMAMNEAKWQVERRARTVNPSMLASKDFNARIKKVFGGKNAEQAHTMVSRMLRHRSGTPFEDLYVFDLTEGEVLACVLDASKPFEVMPSREMRRRMSKALEEGHEVVTVHNHPGSSAPSYADLLSLHRNGASYGVIACHDGSFYRYSRVKDTKPDFDIEDENLFERFYNSFQSKPTFLGELEKRYGIHVEHLE